MNESDTRAVSAVSLSLFYRFAEEAPPVIVRGGGYQLGDATDHRLTVEVSRIVQDRELCQRARDRGALAMRVLSHAMEDHPNGGPTRGAGLLMGVEWVSSKDTRDPVDAEFDVARRGWGARRIRRYPLRTLHHGGALVGDATNFVPTLRIEEPDLEGAPLAPRESLDEVFGR